MLRFKSNCFLPELSPASIRLIPILVNGTNTHIFTADEYLNLLFPLPPTCSPPAKYNANSSTSPQPHHLHPPPLHDLVSSAALEKPPTVCTLSLFPEIHCLPSCQNDVSTANQIIPLPYLSLPKASKVPQQSQMEILSPALQGPLNSSPQLSLKSNFRLFASATLICSLSFSFCACHWLALRMFSPTMLMGLAYSCTEVFVSISASQGTSLTTYLK